MLLTSLIFLEFVEELYTFMVNDPPQIQFSGTVVVAALQPDK